MRKLFFAIILSLVIFLAPIAQAQNFSDAAAPTENTDHFKAQIIKIEQEAEKTREDGSKFKQQNLLFKIISGARKGEEATYYGISEIEVGDANIYKIKDKVYVDAFIDETGQKTFYIVDYIRSEAIYLLTAIFVIFVIIIGRSKGIKALISLVASFVVIIKFILPQILAGHDPFLISLAGGLMIMFFIIYLTEGFNRKSHIAIFSVLISLIITLILSLLFTDLARLTGLTQEESIFLIGIGQKEINFRGLLLAGMIIGAIGVLDDIILGQIEAVDSIRQANPKLPPKKIFQLAYKVGNTHLGAITNTLFLTYAGAALPLLLLFSINYANGLSLDRALNAEVISTEIIRTLVGAIGVMASMPIATFLASINMNFKLNWKKGLTTYEKK
jgi:uncharacterized membrane protein